MRKKNNPYRWVVLAVACIAFFSPSYTQYQLSPLAPQLCQTMGLTASQFSGAFSSPMLPAVFFSLVIGLLADKVGIKWVVGLGLGVSAFGTVLRLFAPSYPLFFSSMLLSGVGAACLNATGIKLFSGWFPVGQVDKMMGLLLSASTIGMAAALATTALFPSIAAAYGAAAALSAAVWLLWMILMKDPAKPVGPARTERPPLRRCLLAVVRSKALWLACGALMAVYGCEMLLGSFLPSALAGRGMPMAAAGVYTAVVTFGTFFGCLAGPFLMGRCPRPRLLMLLFPLVGSAGMLWGWRLSPGPLLALALGVTGFVIGGLQPLLIALPVSLPEIGPQYAGTAGGIVSTMQLLGAVLIPTCIAAPLAGDNWELLLAIGAGFLLLAFGLELLLARRGIPGTTPSKEETRP